jgi:hypothetical protein
MTPSAGPSSVFMVTGHLTCALLVDFVSGSIFLSSPCN